MSGSVEQDTCDNCGKEAILRRDYLHLDLTCECHSPSHFIMQSLCDDCNPKVISETTAKLSVDLYKHSEHSFDFVKPESMKELGFDLVSTTGSNGEYLKYQNDGTKLRNKDYHKICPEPAGKVIVYVNLGYSKKAPFVGISNDADTRNVYNGIVTSKAFLIQLLNNIR